MTATGMVSDIYCHRYKSKRTVHREHDEVNMIVFFLTALCILVETS